MARVLQVHPGNDGLVRVATVKTQDSVLKRPVHRLHQLPMYPNYIVGYDMRMVDFRHRSPSLEKFVYASLTASSPHLSFSEDGWLLDGTSDCWDNQLLLLHNRVARVKNSWQHVMSLSPDVSLKAFAQSWIQKEDPCLSATPIITKKHDGWNFHLRSLSKRNEINPFLKRMVTEDEKWVTYYKTVRKRSWSKCGEAAQTMAKPGLTARKVLLCIWWDWKGIIY
ncbi:hypothetical protein TNCV_1636111 [Trichonephila clavipes]|uniref:DUF5641 domain-containing protein n=1 Tax=Trichonephila clavipes TaxID=2585209 RepID=A0A8X6RLR3_TRICX|nr:hypothetical protein TNCV_1636111 [Trichonephila clavipes]